jgi:hypothetical protein
MLLTNFVTSSFLFLYNINLERFVILYTGCEALNWIRTDAHYKLFLFFLYLIRFRCNYSNDIGMLLHYFVGIMSQ